MTDRASAGTARTTPDGRFTYRVAGSDAGDPIVFVHGIGGAARLWEPQLAAFAPRHCAIAWDLPGYGGSPLLAETSIATYAAALAAFCRALGLDRPVLVGHSIGGMIVQRLLADELLPVRAAVLAQTTPAFGGRDPAWARDFVAARLRPLDEGATMASLAPGAVTGLVGQDPDPAGIALATSCFAAVPEAAFRASVAALVGFDLRQAAARISVPTLLLAGSEDTNAPAATMAKMAATVPGAAYGCLDGVGHLANVERPDAFNAALATFLDGLSR